jgi:hypothetical protein
MAELKGRYSGAAVAEHEERIRLDADRIKQYQKEAQERVEEIKESRVLSDKDLQIVINSRD